ncbi:hypothetical protein VNO80_22294 [Phaseolus coccineus]|uniref:Uncharacterized protein n=1 Tax=Phaseolus coccineus TaxID=3886 RepID=A0AAN9M3W6_PHACN
MDGLFFSFHFGYIVHDRFWRNHINSLWLFIFVKHASCLVENTLLSEIHLSILVRISLMQFCIVASLSAFSFQLWLVDGSQQDLASQFF